MKYHALFVIFEKSGKILNCRLLQIIGGALRAKFGLHLTENSNIESAFLCSSEVSLFHNAQLSLCTAFLQHFSKASLSMNVIHGSKE